MLNDQDYSVRASAIEALDLSALEEGVLLRMALGDSDGHVRSCALRSFINFPAAALAEHVPALLLALEDSYSGVCELAAETLQKVDGSVLAPHAIVLLAKMLNAANRSREAAATALGLLPSAALAPHLAEMLPMLGKDQAHSRGLQVLTNRHLQKMVAFMPANDVASVLTVRYKGEDQAWVRQAALNRVIGELPEETLRLHAPLLMSMLLDRNVGVRERAICTLQKLDPSELAKRDPALLLLGLLDRVAAVRRGAVETLCRLPHGRLTPHAAEVLRMLWDPDRRVRQTAMVETRRMIENFQAPALKEQLRRAAVDACTGDGVLETLR
jgi:HEAT repeat protein